ARDDVVVELRERRTGLGTGLLGAVDGQRQLEGAQVRGEGVEHLGGPIGHDPPRRVGSMPRQQEPHRVIVAGARAPGAGSAPQSRNGSSPQSGNAARRAAWTARSRSSSGSNPASQSRTASGRPSPKVTIPGSGD